MKISFETIREMTFDTYCVKCKNAGKPSEDYYQTGNDICDYCEFILNEDGAELTRYAEWED